MKLDTFAIVEKLVKECVSPSAIAYCGNHAFSSLKATRILNEWKEQIIKEAKNDK